MTEKELLAERKRQLEKIVDLAILSTVDIVHEVYKVSPTVANLDRTLNIIRARWAVLESEENNHEH